MTKLKNGNRIFDLSKSLWPINRSITGNGVRKSLRLIKKICPNLKLIEIKSRTKVFDWTVPDEWNVEEAYIVNPKGKKICNISKNNLHLVSYSSPINKIMNLAKLQKNLYSIPKKPNSIPYITSYYKKSWGFCLSENNRRKLKKGKYKVYINSSFSKGSLTIGEIFIKGRSKKEFFISTNICHPSLANNEISGPSVTTFVSKFLNNKKNLNYSYRIIFIPETIGSLSYMKYNLKKMKSNIVAGLNIVCVGDERCFSYLPTRKGDKEIDRIIKHILKWTVTKFKEYSWEDRGSDERQYCSPGIDLPIASLMRSKYGEYPEYHTSDDKLNSVVTAKGLFGSYNAILKTIEIFEKNSFPKATKIGEPFLHKYNLYHNEKKHKYDKGNIRLILNILSESDGNNSLLQIADKSNVPIWTLYPLINKLVKKNLIKI
tara:strand:+ start:6240 stop:7529 length:1290 start_codon:yes stop_codon:yes gene_type:complete